jgi:hypothetical protein
MKKTTKRKNKPGAGRPKGTTKPPTERLNVGMTITELMSSWLD